MHYNLQLICEFRGGNRLCFPLTIGIQKSEDYRFNAIAAEYQEYNKKDITLVFQFSVMREQKRDCGGGYMKFSGDACGLKETVDVTSFNRRPT
ncbi:putative calreticulin/calnexin, concanavalin A-like lectin/glucanase domain superfamily [Helianthus annuus]|uniref:Concanavalin A-like lectin/glucanase domain superfamily n=1 Tax=Helianthus annuus TaxID=4232 RepID=A0A9K3E516_HELAN|nr:putative concanavalin A-like lectin/glucanase domain superfamily [Helianthus annuus]KAJ0846425.1 putative calreticulin/calnexin, concanavalin A-like lectin/glucanase domain superfamily [Helianthus annuus]